MAMVHAGLPMKCMVVAVCCTLSENIDDATEDIVIDPTEVQEQVSSS